MEEMGPVTYSRKSLHWYQGQKEMAPCIPKDSSRHLTFYQSWRQTKQDSLVWVQVSKKTETIEPTKLYEPRKTAQNLIVPSHYANYFTTILEIGMASLQGWSLILWYPFHFMHCRPLHANICAYSSWEKQIISPTLLQWQGRKMKISMNHQRIGGVLPWLWEKPTHLRPGKLSFSHLKKPPESILKDPADKLQDKITSSKKRWYQ